MSPSSLVWKRDLARIRLFLHLKYGRLLGIPPHTSQFTTMKYGGTYRLKQNFTLHVITTCGIDARLSQIQLVQQQQKHLLIKLWKILY